MTLLALCAFGAAHNFITPERTDFMQANPDPCIYQWVSLDHISRHAIAAALLLEDAGMGDRFGAFVVSTFIDTAREYLAAKARGEEDTMSGRSTIPQQLVKNLYFSSDRSILRKAGEALMAMPFAWPVSDSRMVELYLNYAQFGPRLYGICAASWYYFDTPPWSMTLFQGAQLAAIPTLPSAARRANGGGVYVVGPESDPEFKYKVHQRVSQELQAIGGYGPLMESVDITDSASDHEHASPDSRSTKRAMDGLMMSEGFK